MRKNKIIKTLLILCLTIGILSAKEIKTELLKISNSEFTTNSFLYTPIGKIDKLNGTIELIELTKLNNNNNNDKNKELFNLKTIQLEANLKSLKLSNHYLLNILKSKNYFNVKQFPKITMKSKKIKHSTIIFEIKIKNITKEILFTIVKKNYKAKIKGLKLEGIINREDFELEGKYSSLFSKEIILKINLYFKK